MENASRALVMAGSVLIGILILSLMTTLFINARTVSKEHEATKNSESIQQFNVNFIKYVGKDLSIHEVVTICNFAINNGFKQENISGFKTKDNIANDEGIYILKINSYSDEGYINSIGFSESK